MCIREQKIGKWKFFSSDERLQISRKDLSTAKNYLQNWRFFAPQEKTWISCRYGIPSLCVSLKCSINGLFNLVSIDPAPVGIGIAKLINPHFSQILGEVSATWPKVSLLADPGLEGDDKTWLKSVTAEEAEKFQPLLLVRTEVPTIATAFAKQAVAPILSRFDNSYGVHLNLWEEVVTGGLTMSDWASPFILRAKRSHLVKIWHPDRKMKKRLGGVSTKGSIEATLKRDGSMYYQRFIDPMSTPDSVGLPRVEISKDKLMPQPMIYKLFFLYDFETGNYVPGGGVYMSRCNLRVHGTPDTLFGPVG